MRRPLSLSASLMLLGLCICLIAQSGCQSASRSFQMDSNSRSPWFGLNMSLPKSSSKRKTLQTISDQDSTRPAVATAEFKPSKQTAPSLAATPATPKRSLLPQWLGGAASQPMPVDAPTLDPRRIVELQGPREEFR